MKSMHCVQNKLQEYILDFPDTQVAITDIVNSFWHDTVEIEGLAQTLKPKYGSDGWKELKKMKATLRNRKDAVELAFNQLFLAGKIVNHDGLTYSEMKERAVKDCKESIVRIGQMVEKGEGGVITACWLENLKDYLDHYQHTEILKKDGARGALICVGSEITTWCYPTTITKGNGYVQKGNAGRQGGQR